jgi:hypothetical protein
VSANRPAHIARAIWEGHDGPLFEPEVMVGGPLVADFSQEPQLVEPSSWSG